MSDIEIEIDGKQLKAKPNAMVIQVADEAGIYIPRFCYHKHLSVAANCRMCLVDVEKSGKALPACATPVTPGMKVFTRSKKALAAQKAVMEFLLINHPLDCPICDQGGECELQDLSMGYGAPDSSYTQGKRSVKDKDIGPLIATDMTRCIQCTRCVRFGDEVAGLRELGAIGRGEHMEIETYVEHMMHSEVSGNIIDLCPVGALTSKPFRFSARAWELDQYPSIAPHDCIGSNINVHVRYGKVMRVVPRENTSINETWISDRDRYSYEGLAHLDRIQKPMIRVNGILQETTWEKALEKTAEALREVVKTHGADVIAALLSPQSTTEESYLFQKLIRQMGSPHIDHRLRQVDCRDEESMPLFPGWDGNNVADLEQCDRIFLIGSNIQFEQPSAGLRLRKAVSQGTRVVALNMLDYRFHFNLAAKNIVAPHHFAEALLSIAKYWDPTRPEFAAIQLTADAQKIAECFSEGQKSVILLGAPAFNHPNASMIRDLVKMIAEKTKSSIAFFTEGANAAGAWLAGAIPHRGPFGMALQHKGFDAQTMLKNPQKAYVLLNVEPDLDCANPVAASQAMQEAECVISLSAFHDPHIKKIATVILPITPFTETAGTFVNVSGEWQSFRGVALPVGESKPAWKVLRVLAHFLNLQGFDYESSEDVLRELTLLRQELAFHPAASPQTIQSLSDAPNTILSRIGDIPIYSGDALQRRAKALQATQAIIEGDVATVRMHSLTAEKLALRDEEMVSITQQNNTVSLPVLLDDRVPEDAVWIPGGTFAASGLSDLFGMVEVNKKIQQ